MLCLPSVEPFAYQEDVRFATFTTTDSFTRRGLQLRLHNVLILLIGSRISDHLENIQHYMQVSTRSNNFYRNDIMW